MFVAKKVDGAHIQPQFGTDVGQKTATKEKERLYTEICTFFEM